jgi:hypothetical protein
MAGRCSGWLMSQARRSWCGCASAITGSTISEAVLIRSDGHNSTHGSGLIQATAAARAQSCRDLVPGWVNMNICSSNPWSGCRPVSGDHF